VTDAADYPGLCLSGSISSAKLLIPPTHGTRTKTTDYLSKPSDDPLTLRLHDGEHVIGDGLHRAKTFLVASAPTTIPVYVPLPIAR
jgi:hypothetical protein